MLFVGILSILIFSTHGLVSTVKKQPTVQLKNAVHGDIYMPVVGLGTGGYGNANGEGGEYWGSELGHNATLTWLKVGGRLIDSAGSYLSRDGIGSGWKASGVPRSEIFITSKVRPNGYDETFEEFDKILKSLQTDYVDLLLIHWPGSLTNPPNPPCKQNQTTWAKCRVETWRALETLFQQDKVRAIGVSNYQVNHIVEIMNLNSLIPSVNQVEFHPYWHEDELLNFCQKNNITFTGYSSLGTPDRTAILGSAWNSNPVLLKHPKVIQIAQKFGKSTAQILLRWSWQQSVVLIPRTKNPVHMVENMSIFDFELDDQSMMILSYLNRPMSKVTPDSRLML